MVYLSLLNFILGANFFLLKHRIVLGMFIVISLWVVLGPALVVVFIIGLTRQEATIWDRMVMHWYLIIVPINRNDCTWSKFLGHG